MAKDEPESCPKCGKSFKSLGLHWNRSSDCGYPELSDKQKTLLEAIAIDGMVEKPQGYNNASVSKTTSNKDYADWLIDNLGFMCRTHTMAHTDSTFGRDSFRVRARSHPWINNLYEKHGD